MSYRLIDSNAIAIKYPEVNEMPCVFADLPDGLNGQFIDAQPEPLQVAQDIATIIENERDMRAILSQPEPHWIPCNERLPDVGQDVLFSVQDLFVSEGCLRDDGDWSQFRWQAIQKKESVTAWMPLPEPYQPEEYTMEEFMYGQDMGNPEDGSL